MIIMRGLPGSGKSTSAKEKAVGGEVFSTDDFFMSEGKYMFDPTKLKIAHEWNQNRVNKAMEQGVTPIVVDNTNVVKSNFQPYLDIAKQHGYAVEYAEPESWWWKKYFGPNMSPQDKDELTKKLLEMGTHNVPEALLRRMIDNWEHDPEGQSSRLSAWIKNNCKFS